MMGKKNILLVTNEFPYGTGERTFLSAELVRLQEKFNVILVALTSNEQVIYELPKVEKIYNLSWRNYGIIKYVLMVFRSECIKELSKAIRDKSNEEFSLVARTKWILRSAMICGYYEKRLLDIILDNHIDLVYTYWCTEATVVASRLKTKVSGLKVITRFHGYDLYPERSGTANWQAWREEVCRGSDGLFFVCETGRDYFINKWPIADIAKCHVAYLGCSRRCGEYVEKTKREDFDLVMASCSRSVSLKRIDLIIKTLALIPGECRVRWIYIGDGPMMPELREQACALLDDKENVSYEFYGQKSIDEVMDTYKSEQVELFITTSETEGLPVSVMEAMSLGIPAIATDVGGMREVVTEETGILLSSKVEEKEVLEGILKYIGLSEEEKKKLSMKAFDLWNQKFDSAQCADEFVARINNLVS